MSGIHRTFTDGIETAAAVSVVPDETGPLVDPAFLPAAGFRPGCSGEMPTFDATVPCSGVPTWTGVTDAGAEVALCRACVVVAVLGAADWHGQTVRVVRLDAIGDR